MTTDHATTSLTLSEAERALLEELLNQEVIDTHVERRRTEAPVAHDQVARREEMLRVLLGKVRTIRV
jgi:hypothetical protein